MELGLAQKRQKQRESRAQKAEGLAKRKAKIKRRLGVELLRRENKRMGRRPLVYPFPPGQCQRCIRGKLECVRRFEGCAVVCDKCKKAKVVCLQLGERPDGEPAPKRRKTGPKPPSEHYIGARDIPAADMLEDPGLLRWGWGAPGLIKDASRRSTAHR